MIKLVIIDFDDTLCLTEESCFYLENDVAKDMGFKPQSREIHQKTWGQPLQEAIIKRFLGIDSTLFMKKLTDKMKVYIEKGELDNISIENLNVLDYLIKQGKDTAILTSRTKGELIHVMSANHALSSRIKYFHYQESGPFSKPDPRVFDQVLEKFSVSPAEAIYIGDSPSDAICAKAAGIYFIATLESGLRKETDFEVEKVDSFIVKFNQLPKAIEQFEKNISNYNNLTIDKQNELLCEVDKEDNLIGPVSRRDCHNQTRKPWHRTTHVYLFNKNGELYLSQRSLKKDTAPGLWTVSAGGHVNWGMSYKETAVKELQEELKIQTVLTQIDKLAIDYGSEREIIGIFAGKTTAIPAINQQEVRQIKSFNLKKLISDFNSGKFDLSGGSRDSFKHILKTGSLLSYSKRNNS